MATISTLGALVALAVAIILINLTQGSAGLRHDCWSAGGGCAAAPIWCRPSHVDDRWCAGHYQRRDAHSGGSVNMAVHERLKLLPYETLVGFTIAAVSALMLGVFNLAG